MFTANFLHPTQEYSNTIHRLPLPSLLYHNHQSNHCDHGIID